MKYLALPLLAALLPIAVSAQVIYPLNLGDPRAQYDNFSINSTITNAERGWRFTCNQPGVEVVSLACFVNNGDVDQKTVSLWDSNTQAQLATSPMPLGPGWQTVTLGTPVALTQGSDYIISVHTPSQYFFKSTGGTPWQPNDVFTYGDMRYTSAAVPTFPTSVLTNYQYGVVDFGYRIATATLNAYNPYGSYRHLDASASGEEIGWFEIQNGSPTNTATLTDISLTASGTGNDSTAFTDVAIYEDANGNGYYDGADTAIDNFAGWSTDNGTQVVTVPAAQQTLAAAETKRYFVVVQLNGSATTAQTFNFSISDISVGGGQIKAGAPTRAQFGFDIQTSELFFRDYAPTPTSYTNASQGSGGNGFLIADVEAFASGAAATLSSMTFRASGTLADNTAFSSLELYEDTNANGTFDSGVDTLATSASGTAFSADNGDYVATLVNSNISAGSSVRYFLLAKLAGTANVGETFFCWLESVSATGSNVSGVATPWRYVFDITSNNAPTITASAPFDIIPGSNLTAAAIATVSDVEDAAGSLTVTAITTPTGITVSNITNTGGNITADIDVTTAATVGSNTVVLQVEDSQAGTNTANLTINVNTPPVIGAVSVTVQPSALPTNHTIANVSDADEAAGNLTVTVASAPIGINITAIVNTAGVVTADVEATAAAALGANSVTLQVDDSNGSSATTTLTVQVGSTIVGGGGGGGGGGCTTGSKSLPVALIALIALLSFACWRRRTA
ncbi:MAG: DUF4082 domain-containing protein [Planctomycetes bacterium]|nr:DUF4082 domain-containing protein [Planctomycetota bacterium]